jgi:hypothetical protein
MQLAAFRYIGLFIIVFVFTPLLLPHARAEGINFNAEYLYTNSDGDTKIKATGEKINTNFDRFDQRYNLDISKNIYPYLIFSTGSIYEYNKLTSETEGDRTRFREEILRPFAELTLNNPIYQAGVSYRGFRIEEDISDLPETRSDRDEYTATVGMTPSKRYPDWNFTFRRTLTDDDPKTIDEQLDVYFFETQYNPITNLLADYSYTRRDTDDKLRNFDTKEQTHFGKIAYSKDFLDQRLFMNTGYNIRYNKLEFPRSATLDSPLVRAAGLSSLDNTPDDGPALTNNPALIDGNLFASAGLDLGLNGDQTTSTNIGLDFGLSLDVDQIRIWVDRRLSAAVADSFSWRVYTSPDNLDTSTWTLWATVFPADFATFDNRFEIRFPEVNTRFIKVVTEALAPAVPGSAQFPNIFVTEMEAFVTVSGEEIGNETKTIDQNFNFNVRGQISDRTVAGYNLLYTRQDQDPFDIERSQLTNDLFFNHIFNQIFSITGTGQRTDSSFENEDTTTYNYGASLVAAWLNTFSQSLTYSGTYLDEELGDAYQNSIFLRNNATLYRGWSLFLDGGYGWEEPVQSNSQITTWTLRSGTNIKPNNKISLNLNYLYTRTDQPDLEIGPETDQQFDIQAFFNPFDTLSLFAKVSIVDRDNGTETFQNYSLNWAPFPDGDLQFFFIYNETLRSQDDREERVIGPALKWTIGRFGIFDLAYTFSRSEDNVQKVDSQILNANLRIIY